MNLVFELRWVILSYILFIILNSYFIIQSKYGHHS